MNPCSNCAGAGQIGVGLEWRLCPDCHGNGKLSGPPMTDGTRRERIAIAIVCASHDHVLNADRLVEKIRAVESVLDGMGIDK